MFAKGALHQQVFVARCKDTFGILNTLTSRRLTVLFLKFIYTNVSFNVGCKGQLKRNSNCKHLQFVLGGLNGHRYAGWKRCEKSNLVKLGLD